MRKSLFDNPSRFLSRDDCEVLSKRIFEMTPDGKTVLNINSAWNANLRWARNQVNTGGDTQKTNIDIHRNIRGSIGYATTDSLEDTALRDCINSAEEILQFAPQNPETYPKVVGDTPRKVYPHSHPKLWYDETFDVDARARQVAASGMINPVESAGMLCAGFMSVAGRGFAHVDTSGVFRYYPVTSAQCNVSVRNATGTGSGWAGIDHNDWRKIDTKALAEIALDKCERSANPVAVEPGRYTAILEPQAVCDLFSPLMEAAMDRYQAEMSGGPFSAGGGNSKIGQQVLDRRITVTADPMDPDAGFIPFDHAGEPYKAVTWFKNGVLNELSYSRGYGRTTLGIDEALSNSYAFRMSGGTETIDEMIATTERGILVTRFSNLTVVHQPSWLTTGNTRDGLWLIERGKITKAIKNFRINESPLFILNNLEQIGVPQRVYRPQAPAICPPIKVRDFAFTGLTDAV